MNDEHLIISQIVNNEAMTHKYQNHTVNEIKVMLMDDYNLRGKDAKVLAKTLKRYLGEDNDK